MYVRTNTCNYALDYVYVFLSDVGISGTDSFKISQKKLTFLFVFETSRTSRVLINCSIVPNYADHLPIT